MSVTPLHPPEDTRQERASHKTAQSSAMGSPIDHSKDVHPRVRSTTTAYSAAPTPAPIVIPENNANREATQLGGFIALVVIGIGLVMYLLGWQINPNATPTTPLDETVIIQDEMEQPAPEPTRTAPRDEIAPGWWLDGAQTGS